MEHSDYVKGETYRDTISGFEGVGTAELIYLNGCVRIELTGKLNLEGKIQAYVFDIQQIEFASIARQQEIASAVSRVPALEAAAAAEVKATKKRAKKAKKNKKKELVGATGGPRSNAPIAR